MGLRTSSRLYEAVLLVCLAAHVVFVMYAGRMLQMDEAFFKAAGREWAATGRFAAPELAGYENFRPPMEEIYLAHPPIYPFLFGLFCRCLGFERWQCMLFDALIHVCQVWLIFRLARRLDDRVPVWVCFLLALAALPLGKIGRSDELASCFGLITLLAIVGPPIRPRSALVSGVFLGLAAGTSSPAGAMFGLMALNVVWFRVEGFAQKIRLMAVLGVTSLVTFALVVAPILIPHPEAYDQFRQHVARQYNFPFWISILFGLRVGPYFFLSAYLLLAVGGLCWWFNRKQLVAINTGMLWVGPVAALIFVAINFAYKFTYLWFVVPWMLVAGGTSVYLLLPYVGTWRVRILLMTLYLGVAIGAVPMLHGYVVMLNLPPEQRYESCVARVRQFVPPGSSVVTSNYWWALHDCTIYDVEFSAPNPEDVDFIVLVNDKGAPGACEAVMPELRPAYLENHFATVDDHLSHEPLVIAGRVVPDSAVGFGAKILAQMGPRREELERK
jgi:hypothetical protein